VRVAAAALFAVAAGCATFPVAPDEGGAPWIQVNTPHFALATDMKQGPAEELAHMLEDWWAAMSVAFTSGKAQGGADGDGDASEPLLVIALRSQGEREMAHYRLGGAFWASPLVPPAMSIGNIDEEGGRETLKHELAHAILYARLPRVPRWLTEGMAVYLQTARLDREEGTVHWGTRSISETHNWLEFGSAVSVRSLLDANRWDGPDAGAMQFRAGLLFHMLVNRHADELDCYLERLETDPDPDAALQCFASRDGWDRELDDYAYSLSFAGRETRFAAPAAYARTGRMQDAAVHAVLAQLDYMVLFSIEERFRPQRIERARKNLDRALALDPQNLLAGLLLLMRAEADDSRWDAVTKAMVTGHGGDWRAWAARARTPGLAGDERTQAIERAKRLAPEETEVMRLTAFEAIRAQRWEEARTLAIKAWLGGASELSDRMTLFVASAQLGQCADALKWSRSPSETKELNAFLLKVQQAADQPKRPCSDLK